MLSFIDWLPEEAIKKKRKKRMSNQLIKEAQKSGMFISKEKLIEILKQSSTKEFTISQSPNSKQAVVVINI
jgi:hypothetical protein